MAFVTKTWKDRLVEYAGRRKLKNVATGEEVLMDVSRSEGTVSQAGDAFSAANMNNLEQRIKKEFDTVNSSLGGLSFGTDGDGNYGYYGADGSLIPFKSGSGATKIGSGTSEYTKTFDCSSIKNYKKLTVNNFYIVITYIGLAYNAAYTTNEYGKNPSKSYNANTGILTVNSCLVKNTIHWGATFNYDVYCI